MSDTSQPDPQALQRLAQDWQTIWQTEFAGLAKDRETVEVLAVQAHLWQAFGKMMSEAAHAGRPTANAADSAVDDGAVAAQGAAPADAASGAEPDETERLRLRVAELERRLAELDRPAPAKRARRKPAGKSAAAIAS